MPSNSVFDSGRPEPRPDEVSLAFFEGLRQRRLLVQGCAACSTRQLGRHRCVVCSAQRLEWVPASGQGVVESFAVVHANNNLHFNAGGPYNIAIVTLAEGPQIYTNIVQADTSDLRIGMPVTVFYSELESGAVVPLFRPTHLQRSTP